MKVLILTETDDEHARFLEPKLQARGAEILRFDNAQFPAEAELSLRYSRAGRWEHTLRVEGETILPAQISAVWNRRFSQPTLHADLTDVSVRYYVEQEARHFLRDFWDTRETQWVPATPTVVMNAEQKAAQLQLAAELGFELPPTLITNSAQAVLEFRRQYPGALISKACHSATVRCEDGTTRGVFTEVVSNRDLGYLASLRYCPVIFQAYVPKRVELRITVVGSRVFAAEIHSQQTRHTRFDWRRYDDAHTVYQPHPLPEKVERQCLLLVERLGLCYGAIDMIVTPDGRYVFLEINPNGQWLWIERYTGLPISEALCDLLLSRSRERPERGAHFPLRPRIDDHDLSLYIDH
jgi:glutathione synthase/RimK-type ligase-like ATP-grasp enzyme